MTAGVRLAIATACFGGQVSTLYAASIFKLQRILRATPDIELTIHLRDGDALITRARANLVTLFLNDPEATKRVLRAILKTADLCATQPDRVAQHLVNGGFTDRYDLALQALREVPYDKWREFDAEDTIRFYALRLHEIGMIKSSPQKIIADGTDWRFLDELKRELKA